MTSVLRAAARGRAAAYLAARDCTLAGSRAEVVPVVAHLRGRFAHALLGERLAAFGFAVFAFHGARLSLIFEKRRGPAFAGRRVGLAYRARPKRSRGEGCTSCGRGQGGVRGSTAAPSAAEAAL